MSTGLLGGLLGRARRDSSTPGTGADHDTAAAEPQGSPDERYVSLRCALTREEERRRMAVDLHDGPIQSLVNVALRLDLAERALPPGATEARREFEAVRQSIKGVLQDMRRFIFELRPASIEDFALLPVLRQYVQDFHTQYAIPIGLEIDDSDWRLEPEVSINLFRIFQEALTNVRKHAQASQVKLTLAWPDSTVLAEVVDNGRGFDVAQARRRAHAEKRLGLASMEDRARALGGTLAIESSGRGTRIRVTVPVTRRESVA